MGEGHCRRPSPHRIRPVPGRNGSAIPAVGSPTRIWPAPSGRSPPQTRTGAEPLAATPAKPMSALRPRSTGAEGGNGFCGIFLRLFGPTGLSAESTEAGLRRYGFDGSCLRQLPGFGSAACGSGTTPHDAKPTRRSAVVAAKPRLRISGSTDSGTITDPRTVPLLPFVRRPPLHPLHNEFYNNRQKNY